jgi:hypothetical protein
LSIPSKETIYGIGRSTLKSRRKLVTLIVNTSRAYAAVRHTLGADIRLKEFKAILNAVCLYLKKQCLLSQIALCDQDKNPIPILEAPWDKTLTASGDSPPHV